ncbi:hypothetical protein [Nonomuraea sp. NPDC005650]|uniref:hypothetical protein n=1 Tax=Nonomuraea sp. NPDC005650 TaxID=3157045 RepID=UPI0033A3C0C9
MTVSGLVNRLNILGSVEFFADSGRRVGLSGKNAALVCKLALSRNPVPARLLSELLWNTSLDLTSLNTAMSAIRRTGIKVNLEDGVYHLGLARSDIDACIFLDTVSNVRSVTEIDKLLALWRQDPRKLGHDLPLSTWNETFRARDTLLQAISALNTAERDRLTSLDQFLELFPTDTVVRTYHHSWSQLPRPKVLIVDDQIGPTLKDLLRPDYESTVVTSLTAWSDLIGGGGRLHIDVALVDFHLTADGEDEQGLRVLTHLRDHYDIPVLLMSVSPPTGSFATFVRDYRLADVYNKSKRGGFDDIRNVVSDLLKRKEG